MNISNNSAQTDGEETSPPSTSPSSSASAGQNPEQSQPNAGAPSDLPEWEPLTPELVEDDAIRADILLRWLVLLFALLMGATQIAESETLVHIRSGEYLATHGYWPPGRDVFSYTAEGRPWIQLSWLFDLGVAGAYAVGGAILLSVIKALMAAGAFALVHRSGLPGVSTWWLSIVAVLTVLASYRQFTALPESVTLLGLALLVWLLIRAGETANRKLLWAIPPLFLVWSNLDPRMFLGLGVLALFVLGETIGSLAGRASSADAGLRRQLGIVLAASIVATFLNPFGWHAILSPFALYLHEYPALTRYATAPTIDNSQVFPLFSREFASTLDHAGLSGILVALLTLTSFVLNYSRAPLGHVLAYAGILAAACVAAHELAAAAIVGCMFGNLSAQAWYRRTFRQTYTVDVNERLFSMGGRAATVLAVFAIAFLAISGRMRQPEEKRIGLGFKPTFASTITGLARDLEALDPDARAFNFTLSQGDHLIWVGRPVFIDSRALLYAGSGDSDLVRLHDQVRRALRLQRPKQEFSGQDDIWEQAFDRYRVSVVLPRLSDASPDYLTYGDLLVGQRWELQRLGMMCAIFVRPSKAVPPDRTEQTELAPYHSTFRKEAFQVEAKHDPEDEPYLRLWARPKSGYERILSVPRRLVPPEVQAALHYAWHVRDLMSPTGFQPKSRGDAVADCLLAIRHANEGLAVEPNSVEGYIALGDAYSLLGSVEETIAEEGGAPYQRTRRFYQAIGAYTQAARLDPQDFHVQLQLMGLYAAHFKPEMAYQAVRHMLDILEGKSKLTEEQLIQRDQLLPIERSFAAQVDEVQADANLALSEGTPRLTVVDRVYRAGSPKLALTLIRQDPAGLEANIDARLLEGTLLLEAGEPEESWEAFARLEEVMQQADKSRWRSNFALACLPNAQYKRAVSLWEEQMDDLRTQRTDLLLQTIPIVSPQSRFPIAHLVSSQSFLEQLPFETTELAFNVAMCHLETGNLRAARTTLEQLQSSLPDNQLRPLVAFYLHQLTGELSEIPLGPRLMFMPSQAPARDASIDEPVIAPQPEDARSPDQMPVESRPNGEP